MHDAILCSVFTFTPHQHTRGRGLLLMVRQVRSEKEGGRTTGAPAPGSQRAAEHEAAREKRELLARAATRRLHGTTKSPGVSAST